MDLQFFDAQRDKYNQSIRLEFPDCFALYDRL